MSPVSKVPSYMSRPNLCQSEVIPSQVVVQEMGLSFCTSNGIIYRTQSNHFGLIHVLRALLNPSVQSKVLVISGISEWSKWLYGLKNQSSLIS